MSAFSTLLALINAQIKTNGLKAITGAKLNGVLVQMVNELGSGYQFIDIATPATDPGTPDENVWYIASQAGTYTNFGGIIVNENEVCALVWNGSWTKKVTGAATAAQVNQLGQGVAESLGYPRLRNGSIGNSANLTNVTTEVFPTNGAKKISINIRRKNISGYKYDVYVLSTDSAADLHKLVMSSELTGPVHTPPFENNVADFSSLPNTEGIMFSFKEVSISDETVVNPLRITDFDENDIVISGINTIEENIEKEVKNAKNEINAIKLYKDSIASLKFDGANDTFVWSEGYISGIKNGHIYRVYLDKNIDMSGVTVDSWRLQIKVGDVVKYKIEKNSSLPDYTDIVIEDNDSGNIVIGGRCTRGKTFNAYVQDLTSLEVALKGEDIKNSKIVTSWVLGEYINSDGTIVSASTWKRSNPIHLLKGQTIYVVTNETSGLANSRWKIVETNQQQGFYKVIPGTKTLANEVTTVKYTAPKDMYVVCQTTNTSESGMIVGYAIIIEKEVPSIIELNGIALSEQRFLQINRTVKGGSIDNLRGNLVLTHFSDLHQNSENLNRIMEFCSHWGDYIDDVISGGDNVANSFNQTSDNDYESLLSYARAQGVLDCIGNHDTARFENGAYDWTYYVGEPSYQRYIAPYISQWGVVHDGNTSHCYYYKDYNDKKVRLIVIDVMGWDADELSWFESVLSSAITAGLQVLVVSHYCAQMDLVDCTFTSLLPLSTTYIPSDALNAVDTFIAGGGTFVCWLSGHTHKDYFGTIDGHENQTMLVVGTANGSASQTQFDNIQRTQGTKSFDLFNVISIDTFDNILTVFRVGADLDMFLRHIGVLSFDYANKKLIYND